MMVAYKLMRLRKDGTLGSLFINKRAVIPVGEWLVAQDHTTKGFASRPGWHCLLQPVAPHLSNKGRVWVRCEVEDYQLFERPENQGGKWVLAQRMKVVDILGGV